MDRVWFQLFVLCLCGGLSWIPAALLSTCCAASSSASWAAVQAAPGLGTGVCHGLHPCNKETSHDFLGALSCCYSCGRAGQTLAISLPVHAGCGCLRGPHVGHVLGRAAFCTSFVGRLCPECGPMLARSGGAL